MSLIPLIPTSDRSRLPDATTARDMLTKYRDYEQGAQSGRAAIRAACRKQYDMRPPVDPKTQAQAGKKHLPNADWGEHRRMVDEATTPVHRVRMGARRPVQLYLERDYDPDPSLRNLHGRMLAEDYAEVLRHWHGRSTQEELSAKWMTMFGAGAMYLPFKWSWQYRALDSKDILLPKGAKVDPDYWNWFAITDEMPLHELTGALDNPDAAEKLGWNLTTIRALFAAKAKVPDTGEDAGLENQLEERVAEVKRRDLEKSYGDGMSAEHLKVYHFYVREADGRWTQSLLLQSTVDGKPNAGDYLFKDKGAFDSALDVIVPTTTDSGEGEWHSIRGLSVRIHKFCQASNDAKNHALAVARLTSSVILQPSTGSDLKKVQEITLADPITLLPSGFNALNQGIPNPTAGLLEVDRLMQELRDRNIAQYGTGIPDVSSDRPVGTARLDFARSSELKEADRDNLYKWIEQLHMTVLKRMMRIIHDEDSPVRGTDKSLSEEQLQLREALSPGYRLLHRHFIRRAQEYHEFPASIFKQIAVSETKVRRQIGDGNPAVLEARMQQLLPLKAELPPTAIEAFNRHVFDSILGPDLADEFFPEATPADEIDQRNAAAVEHAALAQGIYVPVATTDNHLIHAQTHLTWAAGEVQKYNEGAASKQDTFTVLRSVEIHLAGQEGGGHIGRLLTSPDEGMRGLAEGIEAQVDQLRKLSNQLGQELAAEREAEAQRQAELAAVPERTAREQTMLQESATRQQIDQMQAMTDAQAKLIKAEGQNQTKTQQAAEKAALDREKALLQHENERLKILLEQQREAARDATDES